MNDVRERLFAIVLAAGGSSRLGRPKQLIRVAGEPLVRRALLGASGVCGQQVVAVLGCEWRRVLAVAGDAVPFFQVNEAWMEGLAGSLRLGVGRLPEDCSAALVMLADQPLVDAADLKRLVDAWAHAPERIAASRYDETDHSTIGVPAIFPRAVFPELLLLEGDRGAKALLSRHRRKLTIVSCPHAAVDIDTPGDLARLGVSGDAPD